MALKSYGRGLILWVDDNFEKQDLPNNLWTELFGDYSDRVFRMLDIYVEVVTSYEGALNRIKSFDSYKEAGVFIFCVVDLILPPRPGEKPEMKYGVALAKEIKKQGITLAFLSSSTGGTSVLDEERLGNIPYHVKEPGSEWRFPESLIFNVLSDLRRNISWISLEVVTKTMHETSDMSVSYRLMPETFRHFPFFGPYREFVERCEYRQRMDLPAAIAVRSPKKHCDEFIQQALAIMLYPHLIIKSGQCIIKYGYAQDPTYVESLNNTEVKENPDIIVVIRVLPESTSVDQLKFLVNLSSNILGKLIFVLPNDESVDEYVEYLRGVRILVREELPTMREGNFEQREELLRRTCILSIHQWAAKNIPGEPLRLENGCITSPELLVNPINWITLLESLNIPEALSDPYEIVKELNLALINMDSNQKKAMQNALEFSMPIPFELLLKVGQQALLNSEFHDQIGIWVERTLDIWLKKSWQYPYGISEVVDVCRNPIDTSFDDSIVIWQNSCYEILIGILNEYETCIEDGLEIEQPTRLNIVRNFIDALGGATFIESDDELINWDELALVRWPHRHYPMPSIIHRRLREAGRYLWIQPEILDIATTLPTGRQRYRMLHSLVEYYWSVLSGLRSVVSDLPLGWKWSIEFLISVIEENKISIAWNNEREKVWSALIGLLRNGGPILYLADQIIRGKPLTTGKDNAKEFLSDVHGYGKIIGPLRGSRKYRLGGYLIPNFDNAMNYQDAEKIAIIRGYIDILENSKDGEGLERLHEIEIATQELIKKISTVENSSEGNENSVALNDSVSLFFSDENLNILEGNGWFSDDLVDKIKKNEDYGEVPSLLCTKVDYLWRIIDTFVFLDNVTRNYRYCDGYHFLAVLNDLRKDYKDQPDPNIPLPIIENVIDLFVNSIEGLLAALSFCVDIVGEKELAARIKSKNISLRTDDGFTPPPIEELSKLLVVNKNEESWEVFTLGIPGEKNVDKLCYHNEGSIQPLGTG